MYKYTQIHKNDLLYTHTNIHIHMHTHTHISDTAYLVCIHTELCHARGRMNVCVCPGMSKQEAEALDKSVLDQCQGADGLSQLLKGS